MMQLFLYFPTLPECMKNAVSLYATGLIDVWTKAFGAAHVITRRSVKIKLDKLVCEYYNHVYSVLHRKNTKHDVPGKSKSARQLNKEWKKKIGMKPDVLNGDILDIGKGMEGLKSEELEFYIDPKTTCKVE